MCTVCVSDSICALCMKQAADVLILLWHKLGQPCVVLKVNVSFKKRINLNLKEKQQLAPQLTVEEEVKVLVLCYKNCNMNKM